MKSREKVMKNSLKFVEKVFCNMTCREKLVKTRQKSPKVAKSREKSPKVVKTGQKSKFRIWRNLLYNKFLNAEPGASSEGRLPEALFIVFQLDSKGAKACKSCRSRQELSNEYLLAKFG